MSEWQRATRAGAINRAEVESVDERGNKEDGAGKQNISLLDLFLPGNICKMATSVAK